jgi:hypothetical protein
MAKTLKDHEEVCAERYASIDRRLTNLEHKVDRIHDMIEGFKTEIIKIALRGAGMIMVAICGAVFVIKM